MTRAEHMQWCKDRALEYVGNNDLQGAFASMTSDLQKHPETQGHVGTQLDMMLLLSGGLSSNEQMRNFIEGLN